MPSWLIPNARAHGSVLAPLAPAPPADAGQSAAGASLLAFLRRSPAELAAIELEGSLDLTRELELSGMGRQARGAGRGEGSGLTPEAKKALSSTIRGLQQRLLDDLHVATESAYRLSVRPQEAGLAESARTKRKRLDDWLDE